MAVGVDESRREDESARVDDGFAGLGSQITDCGNAVADDADCGDAAGGAGAVDYGGAIDERACLRMSSRGE